MSSKSAAWRTISTFGARARIVVGVDGSQSAEQALRRASDEAAMRRCDLEIVSCWPDPVLVKGASRADVADSRDFSEREARRGVAEAARVARCRGYQLNVLSQVVAGSPGPTLTALAAGATLLVVGRLGLSGGDDHNVGSVSQYCLAHANCPVEVVSPLRLPAYSR